MHNNCLGHQDRSDDRHIGDMMLFGVTQMSCWRRVELLIIEDVINWSNGIKAFAKPLPKSCIYACYVKGGHGLGNEVVGMIRSIAHNYAFQVGE